MKKTLNNVELADTKNEIYLDDLMDVLREIAKEQITDQDFIMITGAYRIEFHHSSKIFVVEQRMFDHHKLNPEDEAPI